MCCDCKRIPGYFGSSLVPVKKCKNRTLEIMSDAPTNLEKHVTSKVACVRLAMQGYKKDSFF